LSQGDSAQPETKHRTLRASKPASNQNCEVKTREIKTRGSTRNGAQDITRHDVSTRNFYVCVLYSAAFRLPAARSRNNNNQGGSDGRQNDNS
jgi:hypothetical protein